MAERPSSAAMAHVARLVELARLGGGSICIDSGPLIDYAAQQEPTLTLLEPIVEDPTVPIVISVISLSEVVTRPAQLGDSRRVRAIRQVIATSPGLTVVDVDQEHAIETAYVGAQTGLKLPDAAIVATARLAGAAALLGNDRRWRGKPLGVPYYHVDDLLALT